MWWEKMKKIPKISIVLPVYNGSVHLKESMTSICNQTYKDFELIVIDDCSTDNSGEISQSYAEADPRIVYYRNDNNLKLPLSLNKGFSIAKGEFLTWTSCDNIYRQDALEKMLSAIEKDSKTGMVYASMQIIDENGQQKEFIKSGPEDHLIFRNVIGACFLYRKCVQENIGLYNPDLFLCEDYEYWLRIAEYTKIFRMDDCLYQYRRHSQNLSHNNEKEIISKGIDVQKKYYSSFVKKRQQAAYFYAHLRARDIYNPLRQGYLFFVLMYSPSIFFQEVSGLIKRRCI